MKKRIRKIIVRLLVIGVVLITLNFLVVIFIGNINYSRTFGTEYDRTGNERITRTSWSELRTNTRLLNIELKPTCPGYVGSFLTKKGLVDYEYGMFSPTLEPDYELEDYKILEDSVNGYFVRTVENDGEFGLYIPTQQDMNWSLTIYPSSTAYKLRDELLNAVTTANYNVE
ncbi:MAG: hypothetical protein RLN88_03540 [Ekhidna sp.]|uniref:hypothetical protein n=1 Tax=Ekhidna sp. TaxID=2608089 RepID=UPI0032EC3BB4